jgi:hypothetical protein
MYFTRIRFSNLFVLLFSLVLNQFSFGQYSVHRPNEFQRAITFFVEHKSEFKKCAAETGLNYKQVFSIVAPEISEYSSIKNYFESQSLKVLYVQKGAGYSDFSIGFFQMKPSFIERLEKIVINDPKLYLSFDDFLINLKDEKNERKERIKRLESEKWQFKYLKLFLTIVKNNTKNQKFLNEEEKIKFYSTYFNAGLHKSHKEILKEMNHERFPNFSTKKFNYSNVCLEFYKAVK